VGQFQSEIRLLSTELAYLHFLRLQCTLYRPAMCKKVKKLIRLIVISNIRTTSRAGTNLFTGRISPTTRLASHHTLTGQELVLETA
jgi:hypothetical protein